MSKSTSAIIAENTITPFNIVNGIVVGLIVIAWRNTGDDRLVWDSLGVVTVTIFNTVLAIVQEVRAHRALARAMILRSIPVSIRRGESDLTVEPNDIQIGDVILIRRGDPVPADGSVLTSQGGEVDVSLMTGESDPLIVQPNDDVHAGSWCVSGSFMMRVTAAGANTQAAHIEHLVKRVDLRPSPLQRQVNMVFTWSFVLALVLAMGDALAAGTALFTDVDAIRRVATLVLGLIPEGLVFFSTISFITGILQMSRLGITIQKLAALEGLASAQVVCFDKTGTLTTNRLSISHVIPLGTASIEICRDTVAGIANAIGDEGRMAQAFRSASPSPRDVPAKQVVPFSAERKYSACRDLDGTWWTIGAPDVVLTRENPSWGVAQHALSEAGVADRRAVVIATTNEDHPIGPHLEPLCIATLSDEVRIDAASTLDSFARMGIRRVILSGDARPSITATLRALDLAYPIDEADIHERCSPIDKKRVVASLEQELTVVMIGDGVNDLPAMKESSVGIAMSESAAATKLSADIVLAPTAFTSFTTMIDEGRRAIRTVLAVAVLFLSKNIALVALTVISAVTSAPYLLSPRRGALLSLIGVAIPSFLLAARAVMRSPTRRFFAELVFKCLLTGFTMVASSLAVLMLFREHEHLESLLVMTLIASLLGRFIVIDTMPRSEIRQLAALSTVVLLIVGLLMILPTSLPVINIVQNYYEIGGAGLSILPALAMSAVIGLLGMIPWVFLPREQARYRA